MPCPRWCTINPHRVAGASVIHEGSTTQWEIADGTGSIAHRWRRYDDGPPLLVVETVMDDRRIEIEMSTAAARDSFARLHTAAFEMPDLPVAVEVVPGMQR